MANTVKIKKDGVTLHPVTNADAVIYNNVGYITLKDKIEDIVDDVDTLQNNMTTLNNIIRHVEQSDIAVVSDYGLHLNSGDKLILNVNDTYLELDEPKLLKLIQLLA